MARRTCIFIQVNDQCDKYSVCFFISSIMQICETVYILCWASILDVHSPHGHILDISFYNTYVTILNSEWNAVKPLYLWNEVVPDYVIVMFQVCDSSYGPHSEGTCPRHLHQAPRRGTWEARQLCARGKKLLFFLLYSFVNLCLMKL